MNIFGTLDTQQFFATVAQVIPILVVALVVEASQPWFRTSLPRRRMSLVIMAAASELLALVATLYRPVSPTEPDSLTCQE